MLDLEQVYALAIFMTGAFVVVLVTTITYVLTFRKQLLDAEPPPQAELVFDDQRVNELSATLVQQTTYLKTAIAGMGGDTFTDLTEMLNNQSAAVNRLISMMQNQSIQLTGITDRLDWLETGVIQAQANQLSAIGTRLDEWATAQDATSAAHQTQLQEHARLLAELDRELAAQASQATTERQHQTSLIERLLEQVTQLVPALGHIVAAPPRAGQDRLTDIKGIGPVYSGRLYEAGIHTYQQLAAMTEAELTLIIKRKGVDTASWIEQAKLLASQRAKVESIAE